MKVIAAMDYQDFKLKKYIKAGEDLTEKYEKAREELDKERIDILLAGNKTNDFKPFIKIEEAPVAEEQKAEGEEAPKDKEPVVETADLKKDNVETSVKNKGKKAKAE